jgi:hypothetical protein
MQGSTNKRITGGYQVNPGLKPDHISKITNI